MSDFWDLDDEEPKGDPAPRSPVGVDLDEDFPPLAQPSIRIWQMMGLVALVAIAMAVGIAIGPSALPLAIFGGIALLFSGLIGIGVVASKRRSTQQDSLLSIMAIAAERGMPLPMTISAVADQYSGMARRQLAELAGSVHAGQPLAAALESSPRLASKDAVLLTYMGERTGRLPEALRMAANSRNSQMPAWAGVVSRLSYFLTMLFAIQLVSAGIMYFIVPRMEAIFKDFGTPLPSLTLGVIGASHLIIRYFYLFLPLFVINILLLIYLPYSFSGWMNYDVPIVDRLLKRRHTSLILRALSLAVGSKVPIEQALATVAKHYPTWWVRRKLAAAELEVEHGGRWVDALASRGLLARTDAELLESAARLGNLEWAMREVADGGERRTNRRLQAAVHLIFPVVLLGLGVLVFLITAAFFTPLVTLITRLSEI